MRAWLTALGVICIAVGAALAFGNERIDPMTSRSYGVRIISMMAASGKYRMAGGILIIIGLFCFLVRAAWKEKL
jgi:hypothetical protein